MSFEKIGEIVISEIVEAFVFIIFIVAISAMPEVPGKSSIITALVSGWVICGIATPFIIWFELYHEIGQFFKGGPRY